MIDVRRGTIRTLAIAAMLSSGIAVAQQLPMTREGLDGALAQYFAGADRNGDGRLDPAETAEALGYPHSFLTARRDPEPFTMATGSDGRVRLTINGNGPLGRAAMIDAAYQLVDRDGDGALSLAEVQAAGRIAFDAADQDRDGVLDEEERVAAQGRIGSLKALFEGIG